jgi:hypothetical protein
VVKISYKINPPPNKTMKIKLIKKTLAGIAAASLLQAASMHAGSLTLNFSSAGGTILDTNGVGTGFTARMLGTGAAITGNDSNLLLNAGSGVLQLHTSPGADFNGQVSMDTASVVGINLSSLGFSGTEDFTATANFVNITNLLLQPDQLCLVVGTDSTTGVRAGFINFSGFHATGTDANEGFGTLMSGGFDAFDRFFGTTVGGSMTVVISRISGVWSVTVNGIDRMPNSSNDGTGTPEPPTVVGLDSASDLFVGVVAMDVGNDSPWNVNLDTFAVNVSGNGPPAVGQAPQKQLVDEGNPATFSVTAGDNTKAPISYQWLKNGSPLANQTNTTLTINPSVSDAGSGYSVIITNSLGSITSSVAPLYVVIPTGTSSLDFSSPAGGILDSNGVGTGFTSRLPGTGTALPSSDTNLFLDTANGLLDILTTSSDYNASAYNNPDGSTNADGSTINEVFNGGLAVNESLGVPLSSLGFTGNQDLNVTALFPQPFPATAEFDQFGCFVGADTTNGLTRAGTITFANKERFSQNDQTNNFGVLTDGGGQFFGFAFDSTIPMNVLISRTAGVWHYYIDGVQWDPLVQPTFLNSQTNLTAGVFALDTPGDGVQRLVLVDSYKARVFNSPTVKVGASGGNLTFTWNVAGAGLQSNTNLSNPNGWTTVAGATTSPYVIPIPTTGNKFYRIGL